MERRGAPGLEPGQALDVEYEQRPQAGWRTSAPLCRQAAIQAAIQAARSKGGGARCKMKTAVLRFSPRRGRAHGAETIALGSLRAGSRQSNVSRDLSAMTYDVLFESALEILRGSRGVCCQPLARHVVVDALAGSRPRGGRRGAGAARPRGDLPLAAE